MAQHAFGRKHDQRLAPSAQRLPPQQMEILRGGGRLADLDIVACRKLQKTLDATARMFRSLSLVSVRQKHHQSRQQIPLIFAGDDKLIDHDLRAISEVAELRLPKDEGFRIVAAESVFESKHARFGERRIV